MNLIEPPDEHGMTMTDYADIIVELDDGEFEVTDWEAGFIESTLKRTDFTEKQKNVIRKMHDKYLTKG